MCRPEAELFGASGGTTSPALPSGMATTAAAAATGTARPGHHHRAPRRHHERRRRWPCFAGSSASTPTSSTFPLSIRGGGAPHLSTTAQGVVHWAPRLVLVVLVLLIAVFAALFACHRGFRRSVQFWTRVAPLVVEHKLLEFRSTRPYLLLSSPSREAPAGNASASSRWLHDYHTRTAPKVVQIILDLGGIYIKIGQVMSTIGQALLPDECVQALQPLQNGVTPRPYEEIQKIIERSTGQSISDMFVEFDPVPIGSASIAQVHRARLAPSVGSGSSSESSTEPLQAVVVKVQYPEVAEQFGADLANLELVTRILAPDQLPMIRALRERHENELDFRLEASHLVECRSNLMRHWQTQSNNNNMLVTIPRVVNGTGLCTQHVLVMEHLDGTPLSEVLEAEQVRLAKALRWLSKQPSSSTTTNEIDPKEARRQLTTRLRNHYLASAEANDGGGELAVATTNTTCGSDDRPVLRFMKRHARVVQALAPAGLRVLHLYANVRDRIEHLSRSFRRLVRREQRDDEPRLPRRSKLNLARALKTLIRVHGLQLLRDGVYNADPHPGNVLVLPDGRLGLLDYGMVGRLSDDERHAVAEVVVALKRNERRKIADLYLRHGFRASFRSRPILDVNVLHRFATFHLDRVDLSSIVTESGESLDLGTLFRSTVVHSVPDWIAQARRLSGLLMGVTAQALRPVSLAHEWHDIAAHVLKQRRRRGASNDGPATTQDASATSKPLKSS